MAGNGQNARCIIWQSCWRENSARKVTGRLVSWLRTGENPEQHLLQGLGKQLPAGIFRINQLRSIMNRDVDGHGDDVVEQIRSEDAWRVVLCRCRQLLGDACE